MIALICVVGSVLLGSAECGLGSAKCVMMGRLLEAYNEQHPDEPISPSAAAAVALQLAKARRNAVAVGEPGPAASVGARRRGLDGETVLERAVRRRGEREAP